MIDEPRTETRRERCSATRCRSRVHNGAGAESSVALSENDRHAAAVVCRKKDVLVTSVRVPVMLTPLYDTLERAKAHQCAADDIPITDQQFSDGAGGGVAA